jgi:hypothetical protein
VSNDRILIYAPVIVVGSYVLGGWSSWQLSAYAGFGLKHRLFASF